MVNVRTWAGFVRPSLDHGTSTSIDRFLRVDEGANRRRRRKGKEEVSMGDTLFGVNRNGIAVKVIAWDISHWRDEVFRCLCPRWSILPFIRRPRWLMLARFLA